MEYRRKNSLRLPGYDYSQNGYYFVTICTKNREVFLGEIRNGIMGLNEIGCMATQYWLEIPNHFKNVKLIDFIVMPNHVHGIIIIDNSVGACHGMPLRFGIFAKPVSRSLSMIINHFKGAVKRWCNQNDYVFFSWQSRFHEHVIRSENHLDNIREYIKNNPINWYRDRNKQK